MPGVRSPSFRVPSVRFHRVGPSPFLFNGEEAVQEIRKWPNCSTVHSRWSTPRIGHKHGPDIKVQVCGENGNFWLGFLPGRGMAHCAHSEPALRAYPWARVSERGPGGGVGRKQLFTRCLGSRYIIGWSSVSHQRPAHRAPPRARDWIRGQRVPGVPGESRGGGHSRGGIHRGVQASWGVERNDVSIEVGINAGKLVGKTSK